jgi:hypothetical protein
LTATTDMKNYGAADEDMIAAPLFEVMGQRSQRERVGNGLSGARNESFPVTSPMSATRGGGQTVKDRVQTCVWSNVWMIRGQGPPPLHGRTCSSRMIKLPVDFPCRRRHIVAANGNNLRVKLPRIDCGNVWGPQFR